MHTSYEFEQLHAANGFLAKNLLGHKYWGSRYPAQLARMRRCSHRKGDSHQCGSTLCLLCSRWRNEQAGHLLRQSVQGMQSTHPNSKLMFVSPTLGNVRTDEIGKAARHLHKSWGRFTTQVSCLHGSFRATEIAANPTDPETENVHCHGILAISPGGLSGRNYRSKAAWNEAWADAAKEAARDIDAKPVYDLDGAIAYMLPATLNAEKDYVRPAEVAHSDPERYPERIHQQYRLNRHRYGGNLPPRLHKQVPDGTGLWHGMNTGKFRSFERKLAYDASAYRSRPLELLPVAT
jgi:hypothetical protein